MYFVPICPTAPSGLNCLPIAPSEEITLGLAGFVSFFWPAALAVSWMGLLEDMVRNLGADATKVLAVRLRIKLFMVDE